MSKIIMFDIDDTIARTKNANYFRIAANRGTADQPHDRRTLDRVENDDYVIQNNEHSVDSPGNRFFQS